MDQFLDMRKQVPVVLNPLELEFLVSKRWTIASDSVATWFSFSLGLDSHGPTPLKKEGSTGWEGDSSHLPPLQDRFPFGSPYTHHKAGPPITLSHC